jgi:putative membrane protein
MNLIGELIINVLALFVVEYVIPGFYLESLGAAVVAAIAIGVVNTFIRPVLQIIALPISILTLGIFAFIINVFLLWMVAYVVPGFEINSFVTAAIASIALALTNAFLHKLAKRGGE